MHARIYDFTLLANGSLNFAVVGDYFKILSSTGVLEARVNTGAQLQLQAGQGLREYRFDEVMLTDKSGAANVGKVLIGFSSMVDDRITGEVSVIDGGKARTLANQAFMANPGCAAVAGQFAHVEVWNPVGSGKNTIVKSLQLRSGTGQAIYGRHHNAQIANASTNIGSKLSGGTSPASLARYENNVAQLGTGPVIVAALALGTQSFPYPLAEPIVLTPGNGFVIHATAVNTDLGAAIEFTEELL